MEDFMKNMKRAIRRAQRDRVIKKRFDNKKRDFSYYSGHQKDEYLKELILGKYSKNNISSGCSCAYCINPRRAFGFLTFKEISANQIFKHELKDLNLY